MTVLGAFLLALFVFFVISWKCCRLDITEGPRDTVTQVGSIIIFKTINFSPQLLLVDFLQTELSASEKAQKNQIFSNKQIEIYNAQKSLFTGKIFHLESGFFYS